MAGKPKVVGGVDTHADTMHVSVLTLLGRKLADKEFRTDARGYWDAIRFMTSQGSVQAVGVEGTSSYGAGLTKALITAGITVIEVNRPDRAARRRLGKSDPLDAELAARACSPRTRPAHRRIPVSRPFGRCSMPAVRR